MVSLMSLASMVPEALASAFPRDPGPQLVDGVVSLEPRHPQMALCQESLFISGCPHFSKPRLQGWV